MRRIFEREKIDLPIRIRSCHSARIPQWVDNCEWLLVWKRILLRWPGIVEDDRPSQYWLKPVSSDFASCKGYRMAKYQDSLILGPIVAGKAV